MIFNWGTAVRVLAIIGAAFPWVGSAMAQDSPGPPPPPGALGQVRLGTVSIAPVFQVSNIGFDNNVFDASGVERQAADFTATFAPGVETRLTTNRLSVRALTHVTFVYYQRYKTEQAVNPDIDLQLNEKLSSRFALYANGSYGYAKERTGLEIDSRPRTLSQSTTVGARLNMRKLSIDLHGASSSVSYDKNARYFDVDLPTTLDHHTVGGGGSLGYALSPYTTLTGSVETIFDRFPLAPERDEDSYLTSVGVNFNPRAVIAGSAAISYRRQISQSTLAPNFSGITPQAGLTYKMHDTLSVGVGAERNVQNSFYVDRPYFVYTLYEGSVRQALFHRFDIGGSVQYTTLEYKTFEGLPSSTPRDIVRMGTLNVGVPVTRRVRVGVYGQRWQRLSATVPYSTDRFGFEITTGRVNISPRGVFLAGPIR